MFSQGERLEIVGALKPVDEVFVEESLELKRDYILEYDAQVLVMGDDWAGKFDEFEDICEVRVPAPHAGDLHDRPHREDLVGTDDAVTADRPAVRKHLMDPRTTPARRTASR